MHNLFPTGIDPLQDLINLKLQSQQLTEAVIQLQTNQNELISSLRKSHQQEQYQKQMNQKLLQRIGQQDAEIKELRNSITPRTDTA
jgi:hypothetical protein